MNSLNNSPLPLLIFIILLILLVFLIRQHTDKSRKENQDFEKLIAKFKKFKTSKKFINNKSLIAIDEKNKQIIVSENENLKKYLYSDLLKCSILEDDVVTYQTSMGNVLKRILINNILQDSTGAIPEATDKIITNTDVKKLELKINFKTDLSDYKIKFFDINEIKFRSDSKPKTSAPEPFYRKTAQKHVVQLTLRKAVIDLELWRNIIDMIVTFNDAGMPSNYVSDEIIKLNELKEKGILTEEEFNIQKNKILKNS